MLIIKTNQPNYLVVTVSQNSELANPEYLFSFTHIFSKQKVNFIPVDVSTHKSRYDEFYFVEGTGVGEINFPYSGLYLYTISEQPAGSGNLDPALATNVVENGEAQIIVQTAITVDSQFDVFISNDEFNSNIIFAPDEPNPTPNITPSITPSPTQTPVPASPTPTPSITPTLTPTNTNTPTITPTPSSTPPAANTPAGLGAMWWIDFTDSSTLTTITSGPDFFIATATDKIASIVFTADTTPGNLGPQYFPTGYLGISGDVKANASQLRNPSGTYGTFTEYTWFARMYDDPAVQRGGSMITATNNGVAWPTGLAFSRFSDNNLFPYPPGPVWRAFMRLSGGQLDLDLDINYATWTDVAIRVYEQTNITYIEVWQNGSIIGSTTQTFNPPVSVNDPIFSLMFDGGFNFNTEQFFFNRKLTNLEMATMFGYLTTKY